MPKPRRSGGSVSMRRSSSQISPAVSGSRPERQLRAVDLPQPDGPSIDCFEGWDELHRKFHGLIIAPAGTRTAQLAAQLVEHAERYRRLYLSQATSWLPARRDHITILERCQARDGFGAGKALAEHFARTALSVAALIDQAYEPRLVRAAMREAAYGRG